ALDRVLHDIASSDTIFPIRCLDRDELVASLHPNIRALTYAERVRSLGSHALDGARRLLRLQEDCLGRLHENDSIWPWLAELATQYGDLEARLSGLHERRDRVALEVENMAKCAEDDTPSQGVLAVGCGIASPPPVGSRGEASETTRFTSELGARCRAHRDEQ